ncbi:hypothetical protein VKT23_018666 [Stygiomarasmius scandens]|uniref:Uncharacterized protein n=1 Tax=Marasmiellus scandens TaxID=2682957 RepID=A0ABR1IRC5_9AGAR
MSLEGQDGTPLLSCTLFSSIQAKEAATFKGGLTLPGGGVNVVKDSVGFYRY